MSDNIRNAILKEASKRLTVIKVNIHDFTLDDYYDFMAHPHTKAFDNGVIEHQGWFVEFDWDSEAQADA